MSQTHLVSACCNGLAAVTNVDDVFGEIIASWIEEGDDSPLTVTYSASADARWIASPEIGSVRFTAEPDTVTFHPSDSANRESFIQYASRRWLPRVYNYWGFQVLHAASAYHRATHAVAAFCGPTFAGKSTLAYALGRRPGWAQLTDDVLALDRRDGGVYLRKIPSRISLRTTTAAQFGEEPFSFAPLVWPDADLRLSTIFLVETSDEPDVNPAVVPISPPDAYVELLRQAFIVSETDADARRRLALDYLAVLNAVALYRLVYPRRFDSLDATLDLIITHTAPHP